MIKFKQMKKVFNIVFYNFLALLSFHAFGQQTPAQEQTKPIAIIGATAHIGNGEVINNSLIIFEKGKLSLVADATTIKVDLAGKQVIEANGKHIYPGFILPNSTLGLVEIDAVRASDDDNEIGDFNPHIRSLIAYNAESKVVESMRPNGVLIGQISPRGGRISGTSSVVQFDAWNWEDAAIKVDDGIHLNWPNTFSRNWRSASPGIQPNEGYNKNIQELQHFFNQARAYLNGDKAIKNLPYEALSGIFDGSKTLFVHVNDEKGILDLIQFKTENKLEKLVIVGGYEAYKVSSLLKQHNIAVVLKRIHLRPEQDDEDTNLPYKLAKRLVNDGILVSLEASGDNERMNSRNLPFYAGTTAAYGLSKEQALQLITLNAAKILGIDADYGSLEIGKSATLFISEGDALDMRTNKLLQAFIDGREISLESHQTELWKRYSQKYKDQE